MMAISNREIYWEVPGERQRDPPVAHGYLDGSKSEWIERELRPLIAKQKVVMLLTDSKEKGKPDRLARRLSAAGFSVIRRRKQSRMLWVAERIRPERRRAEVKGDKQCN